MRGRERERESPDFLSRDCEVEKRRRERMNCYMNKLAQMIPACSAVPRRLDKLSILQMAVDHMKSLRGAFACACVRAYLRTCVSVSVSVSVPVSVSVCVSVSVSVCVYMHVLYIVCVSQLHVVHVHVHVPIYFSNIFRFIW